ncbi:nucleoside-diphosphate-sugar epimerase [Friedmanniella endophytica]|uniref:Nucleoside-diphosphate-sugar epimerase n=1 Tax=Microlunatus kandeliicorticis TaxID=1759536 RepID=A0A7W3IVD5_9ACTN|nr:NAD-dependent epimerase/dehydratase family protein [Microlunatus kandeliicorticis]MBA8795947.1 nucleoside-diphosphate-sugar epimerase [Microlunatus kandeliicorticis]
MTDTLVTGGTGYVATRLIADLLASGMPVRTTVRSLDRADEVRDAVRRAGVGADGLSFVEASLTEDAGWAAALDGVAEVHHVASPMVQTADRDAVVVPARDGALRVLRAARDAGTRRVVLTSSFAAVGYTPKAVRDYDESDWTDPETPGLPAYPLSKAVAERAAWDFVRDEGGGLELVVLNPTWVAGPTLTAAARSSLAFFTGMLDGSLSVVPRQRFGIVDVRDLASAHLAAMRTASAAGRRYLLLADGPTMTFREVAQVIGVEVTEAEGEDPPPLIIRNDRAKAELGFRPRSAIETITETVASLRELGLA